VSVLEIATLEVLSQIFFEDLEAKCCVVIV
jgi:hypothetical protein